MKNRFFMASPGLVLLLALSFAACKNEPDAVTKFEGTWVGQEGPNIYTVTISGNNWTSLENGVNEGKGTFTYDDTTFTRNATQAWNGSSWVPISQSETLNYTLSGNKWTMSKGGNTYTYYRQ